MLLKAFPNIDWLKSQIRNGFQEVPGTLGKADGWPTVVLNATVDHIERQDIKGPFSVFLNLKGKSTVQSEGKRCEIRTQSYFVTNQDENYDLLIHGEKTTTLNFHFSEELYRQTFTSLKEKPHKSLEDPDYISQNGISTNTSFFRTKTINHSLSQLMYDYAAPSGSDIVNVGLLQDVLICFLDDIVSKKHGLERVSDLKKPIRSEIFRRLQWSVDFMHENYASATLDELSQVSCMSKYHYLRLFKEVYGFTPGTYMNHLKYQRALDLLHQQNMSNKEIAFFLGFEEVNSFYRFLKRQRERLSSTN